MCFQNFNTTFTFTDAGLRNYHWQYIIYIYTPWTNTPWSRTLKGMDKRVQTPSEYDYIVRTNHQTHCE